MKYIFLFLFIIFLVILYGRYSHKTFILYYHKVDNFKKEGLKSLFVRPIYFNLQMKYLYLRGYKTVSFEELINILKEKKQIPKKIFIITFDDGYKNNYTEAYSILKKYNFKATIFLTADNIGKQIAYPGQPTEEHLNVEEIQKMSDIIYLGAHTVNHAKLNEVEKNIALYEITESKKIIEKLTGRNVKTFCYPFGEFNEYAVDVVRKEYIGACTTKSGLVDEKSDVYLLPRIEFKDLVTMSFRDFFKVWEFYLKILLGV